VTGENGKSVARRAIGHALADRVAAIAQIHSNLTARLHFAHLYRVL
jgi:hypothetical protein